MINDSDFDDVAMGLEDLLANAEALFTEGAFDEAKQNLLLLSKKAFDLANRL